MGKLTRDLRVVVVSPGDVPGERNATQTVVDELNRTVASDRGCRLSLWRWETDARPGLHLEGPQGLIDEEMQIEDADLVVGVFWKRFGTPTHDADSGTEHELRRAWAAWQDNGQPDVMVYFCGRAYPAKTRDELVQWGRVLDFQEALPEQQLWWRYKSVREFEALLREHLTRFVLSRDAEPLDLVAVVGTRVRFNLPAIAAAFQGREDELAALDTALGVADFAVVTQAISGLGGVGKSQLAARYAHQHASEYDVVAWIRAEDGGTRDLAQLAAKLGAPTDGLAPGEQAQLAIDRLSSNDQRWLLVLDNIESPEQLDQVLPRAGNGRVLVTSRDRALRQFGPVLTLDIFDETTAISYLIDRADRPGEETAARELARALGCLPLALSHAAAYCQSGTSFAAYRELLTELPARELFTSHPEVGYKLTVASTWRTSIAAAAAVAPLAAPVLELAAYFAPDAIPKTLFAALTDMGSATGQKRLADAFNALARFNLATVDDTALSVHRLLQATIRDDARDRDDPAVGLCALAAVDIAFPDDPWLPARWPLCEQFLPHALALAEALTQGPGVGARVIPLLHLGCSYLHSVGGGGRFVALAQLAVQRADCDLAPEDPLALRSRQYLGIAHWAAGHTQDAIAIDEALLADRERILGPEHPDTLTDRNNLAVDYRAAGRTQDAIAILEPLLTDRERILGPEHPDTLKTRGNLAVAYQDAGRTQDAIAILEPLLTDRERILGPEHPDTLKTRNDLAVAYQDAGRTQDAIAIHEPLLTDRERILGPEHPDTLNTCGNLANAYQVAGRTEDAERVRKKLRGGKPDGA